MATLEDLQNGCITQAQFASQYHQQNYGQNAYNKNLGQAMGYLQSTGGGGNLYVQPMAPPVAPMPVDSSPSEFQWLRGRIKEIEFRA